MKKKHMLAISAFSSVCLSVLASTTVILASHLKEGHAIDLSKLIAPQTTAAAPAEEHNEQQVKAVYAEGLHQYKDSFGTHDVLLDKATPFESYVTSTGPLEISVEHITMERLYITNNHGFKLAEGKDKVTLVGVTYEITNVSNEDVYFEIKSMKARADNGEIAPVENLLSDDFHLKYEPYSKHKGTIYYMFDVEPIRIATMTLKFPSPDNSNSVPYGNGAELKVKLF